MNFKFWGNEPRREKRASISYSDAYTQLLLENADNKVKANIQATAALEACSGTVGRGFMSGTITGRPALVDALTPTALEQIGRAFVQTGESVWLIDVSSGDLELLPCHSWDVTGGVSRSTWVYTLTIAGPDTITTTTVPYASVLHFMYAPSPARPWRGIGPMQTARLAGRLSAETVAALGDESSGPRGSLLGLPVDGQDETVVRLKTDIGGAKGRMAMVENGDWGNVGQGQVILKPERFGANPGQGLVNLAQQASNEIYSACGFNPSLFTAGDSASLRESWRLALFGVLSPLGKVVENELMKIDPGVVLEFQELRASDIQGRSRSIRRIGEGGRNL